MLLRPFWKTVSVAALALTLLSSPAIAQEEADVFLEEAPKELASLNIDPREAAVADAQFLKSVQVAVDYLRREPDEATALVSRDLLAQVTEASRSRESLDALWDKLDAGKSDPEAPVTENPILIFANLGDTILEAQSPEAQLQAVRLDVPDMPEAVRKPILALLDGKTSAREKLAALADLLMQDSAEGQNQSIPSTPVRAGDSSIGGAGCNETGAGSNLSDGTAACVLPGKAVPAGGKAFSTTGLIAQRSFPLDAFLPCIRNQARRGTCTGFAMVANMELRWAKEKRSRINLSEQHLYMRAEIDTGEQRYRYGLKSTQTVRFMAQKGLGTGYESAWRYNPSWQMSDDPNTRGTSTMADDYYEKSCDGYADYCSGTAFQGRQNSKRTSFFGPPVPTVVRIDNYRIYSWSKNSERAAALAQARAVLGTKPVLLGFSLTRDFMNHDKSGYLVQRNTDRPHDGGHAMLIVGFIPKSQVPQTAPKPVGNGYYIVRNSWGKNWADCGYIYMDAAYVQSQMTSLVSFSVR